MTRTAGQSCGVRCGCSRDKCQWRLTPAVTSVMSAPGDDNADTEDDKENNLRAPVSVSLAPVMKNKRIMAPLANVREEADLEMSFATRKILEKKRTSKKKVAINIKSNKILDVQRRSPDESLSAECSILAPRPEACTNVFSSPAFTKFRTNHI